MAVLGLRPPVFVAVVGRVVDEGGEREGADVCEGTATPVAAGADMWAGVKGAALGLGTMEVVWPGTGMPWLLLNLCRGFCACPTSLNGTQLTPFFFLPSASLDLEEPDRVP